MDGSKNYTNQNTQNSDSSSSIKAGKVNMQNSGQYQRRKSQALDYQARLIYGDFNNYSSPSPAPSSIIQQDGAVGAPVLDNMGECSAMSNINAIDTSSIDVGTASSNNGGGASAAQLDESGLGVMKLATQSTYSSFPSRPMQKVIPTVVYLPSRIAVHMEIEGTSFCPSQVMLAAALGCEELGISNKLLAQSVFALWMVSPMLEIQLKPQQRPFAVRVAWPKLIEKHGKLPDHYLTHKSDEPMIVLRRNVFYPRKEEEKLKDSKILELLYEEAKNNVLCGRYIMEAAHAVMLGGIQARIELGPYNATTHTTSYFRENQTRFLPTHLCSNWSWLPVSRSSSPEHKLLEQFKRVPVSATTRKLMRKYLEFCWALPFYGSAFFRGQIEQPIKGLMSMFTTQTDKSVLIAVNERGVYLIDQEESTLVLGLRYEELSWDYGQPSIEDPECLPCIFLEFDAVENGINVTKLIQIFTKQADMIDALISHFTEQLRRRKENNEAEAASTHSTEEDGEEGNPINSGGNGVLSNKLHRLITITFEGGRCINQMGTLQISY